MVNAYYFQCSPRSNRISFSLPMLQADTLEAKNAIGSAIDAMQSVSRSICMLFSKVRKGNTGNFFSEYKKKEVIANQNLHILHFQDLWFN